MSEMAPLTNAKASTPPHGDNVGASDGSQQPTASNNGEAELIVDADESDDGDGSESDTNDGIDNADELSYQPLPCMIESESEEADHDEEDEDETNPTTEHEALIAALDAPDDIISARGQKSFQLLSAPPSVAEAPQFQAEDFDLSKDAISTIQSLMSGMTLPAGGFPSWTDNIADQVKSRDIASQEIESQEPDRSN